MTDEIRPEQTAPASNSAPKKSLAAAKEPATPVIKPLPTPEEPKTWDSSWVSANDGLVITTDDTDGAVTTDATGTVKKSYAYGPVSWVQGPGAVEAMAEAVKLTQGAARAAGTSMNTIEWIYAMALPKVKLVLFKAVQEGYPGAVPAHREGTGPLKFSISDTLRKAGMEVAPGYRELYPVKKVADSPIGPCVAINMEKSLKTRRVGEKDEEEK